MWPAIPQSWYCREEYRSTRRLECPGLESVLQVSRLGRAEAADHGRRCTPCPGAIKILEGKSLFSIERTFLVPLGLHPKSSKTRGRDQKGLGKALERPNYIKPFDI
jgi:hypothetical protein